MFIYKSDDSDESRIITSETKLDPIPTELYPVQPIYHCTSVETEEESDYVRTPLGKPRYFKCTSAEGRAALKKRRGTTFVSDVNAVTSPACLEVLGVKTVTYANYKLEQEIEVGDSTEIDNDPTDI